MSSPVKQKLQLQVQNLGPVADLNEHLGDGKQNLIYARNGTGKSFITRALRYIDLHKQGQDVSSAPSSLIAEEAPGLQGMLNLTYGAQDIANLKVSMDGSSPQINANKNIFHVFSEDFVSTELRQKEYFIDGKIENQITLDRSTIDTADAELQLEEANKKFNIKYQNITNIFNDKKNKYLVKQALINRNLREFTSLNIETVIQNNKNKPEDNIKELKAILIDLDILRSIPSEPILPVTIQIFELDTNKFNEIYNTIEKITSPSSISQEIKERLELDVNFYESGIRLMKSARNPKDCPFCNQSTSHPNTAETIECYIKYFTDEEGKHKAKLNSSKSYLDGVINYINNFSKNYDDQIKKFNKIKEYIPSMKNKSIDDIEEHRQYLISTIKMITDKIYEKLIDVSKEYKIDKIELDDLIDEINTEVKDANKKFIALTASIQKTDSERKNLQREACRAFEKEFCADQWNLILEISEIREEIKSAETNLDELNKSQLSVSVKERVANTFELLINDFFGKKYTFDKNNFILKRDNQEMARGPSRTLSEGEKTVISFCYFIACTHKKISKTSEYENLFFVFDDPITSMSYDFVFSIAQTLKNFCISKDGELSISPADKNKNYKRPNLLIFTHSSYFYNICVSNNVIPKNCAFFLHKNGSQHKISAHNNYIAPFEQQLREVFEVYEGKAPDHTTGNAIRSVLEAVGRFCHPDKCDNLSNYIIYLTGEENFTIKSVLINNLSHGTYYEDTPSPEDIKDACADVISIVEKFAKGQIETVKRALNPVSKNKQQFRASPK